MTKIRSEKIFNLLKKYYGTPGPELNHENLYQLTISVVLSAQTTDRQVNRATEKLFEKFPDFESLASAKPPQVEKIIRSIGLYKNKAKNIINLSKLIIKNFDGKVPKKREELTGLPGIGRKSANIVLSMGFNIPALAVDTHILRIANRIGYIRSDNPLKVEEALTSFIPEKEWKNSHLILIKHGRTLCMARNPLCGECPVNSFCDFRNNTF